MIGKVFYKTIGLVIVNFYNLHNAMAIIGEKYANNAFLSIFAGAFTPIPYKAIMITALIFQYIYACFICCVRTWKRRAFFYYLYCFKTVRCKNPIYNRKVF
jgi:hypothetical protein